MLKPNWWTIAPALLGAMATTALVAYDDLARQIQHTLRSGVNWIEDQGMISATTASIVSPATWLVVMALCTLAIYFASRNTILRCPRGVGIRGALGWRVQLWVHNLIQIGALALLYWMGWYRPAQRAIDEWLYRADTTTANAIYDAGVIHFLLPMMVGWLVLNTVLSLVAVIRSRRQAPQKIECLAE